MSRLLHNDHIEKFDIEMRSTIQINGVRIKKYQAEDDSKMSTFQFSLFYIDAYLSEIMYIYNR